MLVLLNLLDSVFPVNKSYIQSICSYVQVKKPDPAAKKCAEFKIILNVQTLVYNFLSYVNHFHSAKRYGTDGAIEIGYQSKTQNE